MQTSIQEFTLGLLAYKGALVEADERSAGVLLGLELSSALGMSEYQRLVFDPLMDASGALRVDYDAPSFELMGRLAETLGSTACVRISLPELSPIHPERELERGLRLQNGIYRLQQCERADSLYFCFILQYDVLADERSGGMAEIWVHPATRSMPVNLPSLDAVELRDEPAPLRFGELAAQAWRLAKPAATCSIHSRLRGFGESLERRRERDLRRMADYYRAIDEEIRRKITRASIKEDARKNEMQRLEATSRAYETRSAELLERYRMTVRIGGIAILACVLPTYQLHARLLRRKQSIDAVFSWNPFSRRIEPRCCDSCAQATESASLCDDRVHYLCAACLSPCPTCSRVFCHACHRRCPRNHP